MTTAALPRRAVVPAVGLSGGTLLVLLATLSSPLAGAAAIAGLLVVAAIVAFPFAGFLVTALVVPLERIGRFTNDSSMYTVSLMRIFGVITLGALLLHVLLGRRKVLIGAPVLLYTTYVIVGMVTLAYTSDWEYGVRAVSAILGNLLFFFLVVNIVRTPAQARMAIVCWLAMTAAIGVFTMYQWHSPAAIINEDAFNSTGERSADERFSTVLADQSEYDALGKTARALGTTSHPAVYAINLILTLPFFAYLFRTTSGAWMRSAIALAAAITAYNVVLANTRAALLTMGLVVALIVATGLIRLTGKMIAAGLLLALCALPLMPGAIWDRVLSVSNYSVDRSETLRVRLIYWSEALDIASEHWLLGIGIGNQSELPRRLASRLYMPPNSTVHNEYLQSLIETGLLGYPVVIAFMVVLYRRARSGERRYREAGRRDDALLLRASRLALAAVLIYGVQVDVLHFPLKGWWLAMGIVAALTERGNPAARPLRAI